MEQGVTMSTEVGLVQALLAYGLTIVVALLTAGLIRVIVAGLGKLRKDEVSERPLERPPTEPPAAAFEVERGAHVAAVAAAVHAVIGDARIVHIGPSDQGRGWRTTGRSLHHASHAPRHSHKN